VAVDTGEGGLSSAPFPRRLLKLVGQSIRELEVNCQLVSPSSLLGNEA